MVAAIVVLAFAVGVAVGVWAGRESLRPVLAPAVSDETRFIRSVLRRASVRQDAEDAWRSLPARSSGPLWGFTEEE